MSKKFVDLIKVVLSISLASVILYFVFRNIDLNDFLSKAKQVNYNWIWLSMFISFFAYLLRAYRWRLQLDPLGYKPSTYRMFLAVMTGYLTNLLVPRLGEITRCGVLYRTDKVPISTSFGTVITERIVDVLALGFILAIALFLQYDQVLLFFNETLDFSVSWYTLFGVALILLTLGGWIFFKFIYSSPTKVGEFSRGLIQGLISLKNVQGLKFVGSTILIWIIYYFMSYLVVFSIAETAHLSWEVGFSILVAGVIAFVLPVQSGFGTFHALVSTMLIFYSIDETTGVFFATLLHTSQLLAVLIFGILAMILSIFAKRNEHLK